jgi:hypothetical protein
MDQAVHKLLTDKLYDKRKNGAFESVNAPFDIFYLELHANSGLGLKSSSAKPLPRVTIKK